LLNVLAYCLLELGVKDMHCYGSSTLVEIASIDEGRVSISKTD
jgi:hypothetical protein